MKGRRKEYLHQGYAIALATVIVLAVAGCATAPSTVEEPITRGENGGPRQHVWDALTDMFAEKEGYGMYTYVLFGRRLKPAAGLGQATRDRYESLLKAIHASTLTVSEMGEFDKQGANIILIPATAMVNEPSIRNYHSVLAKRYIALLSGLVQDTEPALSDRLTTRQGPFLISTPIPMGAMEPEKTVFLYADLSTTNSAAMSEIVAAYKRRLKKGVGDVEQFRSLRLSLLALILEVDDNIKIVKTAMAQEN